MDSLQRNSYSEPTKSSSALWLGCFCRLQTLKPEGFSKTLFKPPLGAFTRKKLARIMFLVEVINLTVIGDR